MHAYLIYIFSMHIYVYVYVCMNICIFASVFEQAIMINSQSLVDTFGMCAYIFNIYAYVFMNICIFTYIFEYKCPNINSLVEYEYVLIFQSL
jgi:hypothetical protein